MDTRIAKVDQSWQAESKSPGWAEGSVTDPLPPAVDPEVIAGIRELQGEDGVDLLTELIDMFARDVPRRLADLRRAVEGDDTVAVLNGAHSLKGSSASLGATHLAVLCGQLEQCGRTRRLDGAADLLADVAREFERVRAALDAERAR